MSEEGSLAQASEAESSVTSLPEVSGELESSDPAQEGTAQESPAQEEGPKVLESATGKIGMEKDVMSQGFGQGHHQMHSVEPHAALHNLPQSVGVLGVSDHAMTVSTIVHLSEAPPLVGVCLREGSRSIGLLQAYEKFTIGVMAASDRDVIMHFASRRRGDGMSQFNVGEWEHGSSFGPRYTRAIAHLECLLRDVILVGDHRIVVGEVVSAFEQDGCPAIRYQRELI